MADCERLDLNAPLQPRRPGIQVPLTAMQYRVWTQLVNEGLPLSVRMCAASLRISGRLNVPAVRSSIEVLMERHESLRTRIVVRDGTPTQEVNSAAACPLEIIDLSGLDPDTIEPEAKRIVQSFIDAKIDLSQDPLFAGQILKLSDLDHILILALDHIVSDVVSNGILTRELLALYAHAAQGQALSLQPLPIQFADYAVWQNLTRDAWLRHHGEYWRNRLAGAPRLQLLPDQRVADVPGLSGTTVHFPFGRALTRALREVSRREQILLPLIVLTVYVSVMSRWCAERSVVVLFATHGRQRRPELRGIIGFLASLLHLRIDITAADTFLDLLRRVNLEFNSAHEHQDFDRVPDLVPECSTELYFNWMPGSPSRESGSHPARSDDTVRIRAYPVNVPWTGKFVPIFSDTPGGITMSVTYRPDLFTVGTVQWFGREVRGSAEILADRPDTLITSSIRRQDSALQC